jgi:hypothetical protein
VLLLLCLVIAYILSQVIAGETILIVGGASVLKAAYCTVIYCSTYCTVVYCIAVWCTAAACNGYINKTKVINEMNLFDTLSIYLIRYPSI